MFDAADVLIDRHPVIDCFALKRNWCPGRAETQEIPRRIEEGVERVGLAAGRSAATRAIDMFPGRMMIERVARPVEGDISRQFDREIAVGHRHDTASRAMNKRDRTAPITLPRYPPIAKSVDGRPLAAA